jgi:hypothetical protein
MKLSEKKCKEVLDQHRDSLIREALIDENSED